MRKFPLSGVLMLLPAFALVFLVGCPGTPPKTDPKTTDPTKSPVVEKGKAEPITTATEATIKGTVKIKGDLPKMPDEARIAGHKDAPECLKGKGFALKEQVWLLDDKGGVANVVVSIVAPSGKTYGKIKEELKAPFEKTPAELDQPHCAYIPHVVAVYADVQKLLIKNSAEVSHNVKIEAAGDANPAFDKVLGKGDAPVSRTFGKWKDPINVQCSLHNWMNAKILVFDHPYFAVTKSDGSFEIPNVPIDAELVVHMWHEKTGKDAGKTMKFIKGPNSLDLEIVAK